MNTNHLSLFKQVISTGSISQVAKDLHVSQPAISMMLKRLEKDLGVTLYTSVGRNITATDAGLTLLEYAESILSLEGQIYRVMNEFQEGHSGRIVVGVSHIVGSYLLPRIMLAFGQKHPNISIDLRISEDKEIEDMVKVGNIDIGITLTPPVDHFSLRVTKIFNDKFIGIQSTIHTQTNNILIPSDIPRPPTIKIDDVHISVFSTEAVKQFVREGMGCGIVLESTVKLEISCGRLKYWNEFEPYSVSTNVMTRPAERLSKSVWIFLDFLKNNFM